MSAAPDHPGTGVGRSGPEPAAERDAAAAPCGREAARRTRADRARQVADVLRQQIGAGAFPAGLLPDERVLVADFGVTRNTVREALSVLRDEGTVERRRGVGTVVRRPAVEHSLERLAGLAETLEPYGPVANEVRTAGLVPPPTEVARRLDVPEGGRVVYVERLRRLDGEPLSLDLTYLTAEVGEPLLRSGADLAGHDLFRLIERSVGGPLGSASVSVRAVNGDADTCALLGIPAGAAVFTVERLTRLPSGRAVDLEYLRIRGDRLAFRAELGRAAGPMTEAGPPSSTNPVAADPVATDPVTGASDSSADTGGRAGEGHDTGADRGPGRGDGGEGDR